MYYCALRGGSESALLTHKSVINCPNLNANPGGCIHPGVPSATIDLSPAEISGMQD